VRHPGVKEDALRGGGFTGVDVGHKPNIPYPVQRGLSRQSYLLVFRFLVLCFLVDFYLGLWFFIKNQKRKTQNGYFYHL
jgi:hypothetical protein